MSIDRPFPYHEMTQKPEERPDIDMLYSLDSVSAVPGMWGVNFPRTIIAE